jgi:hypothetical protein
MILVKTNHPFLRVWCHRVGQLSYHKRRGSQSRAPRAPRWLPRPMPPLTTCTPHLIVVRREATTDTFHRGDGPRAWVWRGIHVTLPLGHEEHTVVLLIGGRGIWVTGGGGEGWRVWRCGLDHRRSNRMQNDKHCINSSVNRRIHWWT